MSNQLSLSPHTIFVKRGNNEFNRWNFAIRPFKARNTNNDPNTIKVESNCIVSDNSLKNINTTAPP